MTPAVRIAGALAFATLPASVSPQTTGPITFLPALAGDYFPLDSRALGRRMHIFVRLPEKYAEKPGEKYPVVYLLDGDSLFPMLAPQHLFLHYDEGLPDAIVVGIAYGGFAPGVNMRHVDFRPVLEDGSPGGSARFLQFLEAELLPRVEKRWRANQDQRVLFGQSRGGSFAIYAAYERPRLFHGFVASNPGREADTRLLYGMNGTQPRNRTAGWLIVTSGSRDHDYLRQTALQWGREVAGKPGLPWRAEFIDLPGGTHAAAAPQAYRAAMLRILGKPADAASR
jgi:predicted alpha/beta superfamily hydrolase